MIRALVATASLGAGGLIYAANRPQQLVAAKLVRLPEVDIAFLRASWIRNHGADAFFALAVGSLLAWWSTRNRISASLTTAIGTAFLLVLECAGTFDWIDVAVELTTFAVALFVLRRQSPQT